MSADVRYCMRVKRIEEPVMRLACATSVTA